MKTSSRVVLALVVLFAMSFRARAQSILPRVITEDRLHHYLSYIQLSDDQLKQIYVLNSDYRKKWAEAFGAEISSYNAKWKAVYTDPSTFAGESMEAEFREVLMNQNRLRSRLKAANDEFFDAVEAILTEDQLLRMQRVRMAHDRDTYRRFDARPRERNIDIVQLVESLKLEDKDEEAIQSILNESEPVFVNALRESAEADQRAAIMEFAALDVLRKCNNSPGLEAQAQLDVLQDKGEGIRLRSSRRLVLAIRDIRDRILAVLSHQGRSLLEQLYNETAYPEIYPDPAFSEPFYLNALDLTTIDDSQRAAIAALKQDYVEKHALLSQKIAKALYDQSYVYVKNDPATTQKIVNARNRVASAALEREKLDLSQPTIVRSLLTPEQNQSLSKWQYETQSPPRPWARIAGLEEVPDNKAK